jgi:hypothetical protein
MKTLQKVILAALIAALVLTACSNSSDGDSSSTSPDRPLVSYYIKATGGKYLVTDIYAPDAKLPDPSARLAAAPSRGYIPKGNEKVRVWFDGTLVGTGTLTVAKDPTTGVTTISSTDIAPPPVEGTELATSHFAATLNDTATAIAYIAAETEIHVPPTTSGDSGTSGGTTTTPAITITVEDMANGGVAAAGTPAADSTPAIPGEAAAAGLAEALKTGIGSATSSPTDIVTAVATGSTVTLSIVTNDAIPAGSTGTVSGGPLAVPSGVTLVLAKGELEIDFGAGSTDADKIFTVSGTLTVADGGTLTVDTGSLLKVPGSLNVADGGTLDITNAHVEEEGPTSANSEKIIDVGGTLTIQAGGTMIVPIASGFWWHFNDVASHGTGSVKVYGTIMHDGDYSSDDMGGINVDGNIAAGGTGGTASANNQQSDFLFTADSANYIEYDLGANPVT